MGIFTLLNPPLFQGNLKKKRYFEGWYFKHVSEDQEHILSIIPGISLSQNSHSFIQVIHGPSGKTAYVTYPIDKFKAGKRDFFVQIGENYFSEKEIRIRIENPECQLRGQVNYIDPVSYPVSLFSPGIMGWYAYVPGMECYHGAVSFDHMLKGELEYNGSFWDFTGGKGYIEKDWGRSFPECWVWMQCNNFGKERISLMFSIAKIPWMGKYFIGHLCFLFHEGKLYRFATYTGSKIKSFVKGDKHIHVMIEDQHHLIALKVAGNIQGRLKAPVLGSMERYIKESMNATLEFTLSGSRGNLILKASTERAGLEVVGEIWKYLPA